MDRVGEAPIRTRKPVTIVAFAWACSLVMVGCGVTSESTVAAVSSSSPSAAASSEAGSFNEADVMFARLMIVHHEQAIQMARMAASHAQDPRVKALAARIAVAQAAEARTMAGWLRAWGQPVPTGVPGMMSPGPEMSSMPMPGMMSPMPGMMGSPHPGMSSPSAPGMMSQQEMSQMMAARGAYFDRMFLQMMIRHHQGAIQMADTEQAQGVNPAAKRLSHQIAISQTVQIAHMRHLLEELSPPPTPSPS